MPRGGCRQGAGRKRCMWKTVFMRVPEPLHAEFLERIREFKEEMNQKNYV